MKKSSKIISALLGLCLMIGLAFTLASSAATEAVQDLCVGNATAGYIDFDNYTNNSYHGNGGTQYPSYVGSKAMVYSTRIATASSVLVKSHTVDGRTNKYLDITAKDSHSDISSYAQFALMNYNSADTSKNPFPDFCFTKPDDYMFIDFDLKANYYFTVETEVAEDGTSTEKVVKYETWDEVVAAGKEDEVKLSYPEGLYLTPYFFGFSSATAMTGASSVSVYIVSDGEKWYLSSNSTYSSDDYPLSNDVGYWNHITLCVSTPRVAMENTSHKNRIRIDAYVDGEYATTRNVENTSGYGYSAATYAKTMFERFAFNLPTAAANGGAQYYYSIGIDNISLSGFIDYTPTVENSVKTFMANGGKGNFTECDDVLYNENYISPNGNKYELEWLDRDGEKIFGESLAIGTVPDASAEELRLGSYGGIKGDHNNIAAWEWNVSDDASVFTPAGELTLDMVKAVRKRGDSRITLRPAVADAVCVDALGSVIASDKYFIGSAAESFETESNGWYSTAYPVLANATEGEAADSFTVVRDKENIFTADVSNAIPTASIKGIKFNMSLLTNYYMNIYVPEDAPEGITPLGYFAEEALTNKYTESVRKVSIGGAVYEEHSFAIRNSDIDLNAPRYYGFEVSLGGNTYRLAYKISVDLITYVNGVLSAYSCGSEEAALAVNLLNYANEAYKLANGEAHSSAVAVISDHTVCGCLSDYDASADYKGDASTLSEYVYGAAYDVSSAEPALVLYVKKSALSGISAIRVSYGGVMGEVEGEMTALDEATIDGIGVIPYTYRGVSASDVKEIMEISVYDNNGGVAASGTYGLSNYVFNSDAPVAKALYLFSSAAASYKRTVVGESDAEAPEAMSGITARKTSSLRPSSTVSLGDRIRYTISITNNNSEALTIPVSDMIPANTHYVSGDAEVDGFKLSWSVTVGAGETKEISYVVALDKNAKLLDKDLILTAPDALVGGNAAPCGDENYIARTINSVDAFYMKAGIEAMSYSDEDVLIALGTLANQEAAKPSPMGVLRYTYNVAFSLNPAIAADQTPAGVISAIFEKAATDNGNTYRAMVAPTLWGGSAVTSVLDGIKGESSDFERADLVIGDILFVKDSDGARMYMFDGDDLVSFTYGYEKANTVSVISAANAADYYAVLRPTMTMTSLTLSDPDATAPELTPQQEALVKTAYQYVLRGTRLQYDDGGLGTYSEYRWQIGEYQPEQNSSQNWKYINCAGFTYDIYRTALGYDLGSLYTTRALMKHFTNGNAENDMYPFYFEWDSGIHSDKARQAEIEKKFFDTLQVGDLVVVTRGTTTDGYGHVMMYIGNGMLAHSSGSTRSGDSEYYEPTIRYMNAWRYLFNPTASNYLFIETPTEKTVYQTCIVRPLANCGNIEIPENTQHRLDNLMGIISEKLSSHPEGLTANKGEEITFTYKIRNTNKVARTLSVTDVVPANSVLVSAPDAAIDGDKLSWSVTVGAGETVEVSFTVKATGEYGSYIYGVEGKVGGVLHTCPGTYIENTLTADEQAAILEAIEYYRANNTEGLTNFALVNAIYERAGLPAPFADGVTSTTLKADLFKTSTAYSSLYEFNTGSEYYGMVAPTFYGGGKFYTKNQYTAMSKASSDRSRLPRTQGLVFGDIIVAEFSSSSALYMYTGEGNLVSIGAALSYDSRTTHNRLQRMLSVGKYYTILRPSMDFDITAE